MMKNAVEMVYILVQKGQKYDVMYYTLCRTYRDPDGARKEKEASEPPNGVIWEHIRAEFII